MMRCQDSHLSTYQGNHGWDQCIVQISDFHKTNKQISIVGTHRKQLYFNISSTLLNLLKVFSTDVQIILINSDDFGMFYFTVGVI